MSGKTLYMGAWWLDRPGLLVSLCISGSHLFLITMIFLGPIYLYFSSVRLCYKLQQKLRSYGKVGAVSIFFLSRYMSSQGICTCPILNCKYPLRVVSPGTTLLPLRQKQSHKSYWFLAADRLSSSGVVFRVDQDLASHFQGTKSFSAQSNPCKDFTRCLELATD